MDKADGATLLAAIATLTLAACECSAGEAPRASGATGAADGGGGGAAPDRIATSSSASGVSGQGGADSSGAGGQGGASGEGGAGGQGGAGSSGGAGGQGGAGGHGGAGGQGGAGSSGAGGEGGARSWEPVETDWCSEGWSGLDDHTCFHVPETAARGAPILHVLHGIMAPDALPVSLQAIAAEAAAALGAVAVFPRGRQGLCTFSPSVASYFCWPTRREIVDAEAPALLDEWTRAEARIAQVLGDSFSRRYVMGFSNGGYFASYIALEGLLHVDGAGLVGAGRMVIEEHLFSQERPPIYIAVGERELASTIASAENLADLLTQHGWEHELVVHPGRGHEIHADDFTRAWATWTAAP
ncbi:hypothetical protein WMF31_17515 [Sorangium sp. So ce1036]|uniref:alpha/beta hydrolase n=1 Tax=Sorangium sp. So ce1036 TaxID=3133328 RepID=UPI003F058432